MAEERLPFLLNRSQIEYLLSLMLKEDSQHPDPDLVELFTAGKKLMEEEL